MFLALLATMMIPFAVVMIPQYVMLTKMGWTNSLLPLIIPGEVITEEIIKLINKYVRQGLNVQGVESPGGGGVSARELTIEIIKGRRN